MFVLAADFTNEMSHGEHESFDNREVLFLIGAELLHPALRRTRDWERSMRQVFQ